MGIQDLFLKHRLLAEAGEAGDAGSGAPADRGDAAAEGDDAGVASAEDAAAKEAAAAEKAAGDRIPKARFNEAVGKERAAREAAEAKARELSEKLEKFTSQADVAAIEKEISDLEDQLEAKMAEGTPEERRALRTQIRAKERELGRAEVSRQAAMATAMAVERVRYDSTVRELEGKYPAMDPDSDGYDEVAVRDLLDLKAAYEAKGDSSSEALRKAARFVFKEAPAAVKAAEKKEAPKEPTDEEKKAEAEAKAKRTEEAIRKGQAARAAQPAASTDKGGKDSAARGGDPASTAAKLSDKDFAKLDEETLKRARGDIV